MVTSTRRSGTNLDKRKIDLRLDYERPNLFFIEQERFIRGTCFASIGRGFANNAIDNRAGTMRKIVPASENLINLAAQDDGLIYAVCTVLIARKIWKQRSKLSTINEVSKVNWTLCRFAVRLAIEFLLL